ncbi:MAG: hypothetical protein O3C21_07295 [Verrucomicrobia bacterium]|nr:hypothetical protein [Verrucomicrobiota bacterium]
MKPTRTTLKPSAQDASTDFCESSWLPEFIDGLGQEMANGKWQMANGKWQVASGK